MYCSKCGVQNSDEATQCANCGNVLAEPSQQAAAEGVPVVAIEPKTCGLAIAALVMGILSIFCSIIMAIPAIICGIIALVKISKSNGQLKGNGFAIAGIAVPAVLSLVVVPLMLAILMPALSQTRKIAQRVVCGTNLEGLSTAMMVYVNDYDDTLPTENWCDLLIGEADVSPRSFICPDSDAIEGECCYAINKNIAGMKLGELPANVVLFFETDKGIETGLRNTSIITRRHYQFMKKKIQTQSYYESLREDGSYDQDVMVYKNRFNQFGGPEDLLIRHKEGCNVAFADGHTEFVRAEDIAELQWTAE